MEERIDSRAYAEDEISLIDLWGVLIRRKAVLWGVFALCLVGAIAVNLVKSDKYLYSISVEIGSTTEGDKRALIDNPETVLAKVKEGYIPLVLSEYANVTAEGEAEKLKLTVRVLKKSDLMVIEAKATEVKGEVVKGLERQVIDFFKEDHARILGVVKMTSR